MATNKSSRKSTTKPDAEQDLEGEGQKAATAEGDLPTPTGEDLQKGEKNHPEFSSVIFADGSTRSAYIDCRPMELHRGSYANFIPPHQMNYLGWALEALAGGKGESYPKVTQRIAAGLLYGNDGMERECAGCKRAGKTRMFQPVWAVVLNGGRMKRAQDGQPLDDFRGRQSSVEDVVANCATAAGARAIGLLKDLSDEEVEVFLQFVRTLPDPDNNWLPGGVPVVSGNLVVEIAENPEERGEGKWYCGTTWWSKKVDGRWKHEFNRQGCLAEALAALENEGKEANVDLRAYSCASFTLPIVARLQAEKICQALGGTRETVERLSQIRKDVGGGRLKRAMGAAQGIGGGGRQPIPSPQRGGMDSSDTRVRVGRDNHIELQRGRKQ